MSHETEVLERGDRLDRAAKQVTLNLLWIVPLVVVPIAFYARAFHGLFHGEAIAAAQAAREIAHGHGFATLWAYPIEVALRGGHFPRPDFFQAPFYPLVLAIFFGAFSPGDNVAAAVSLLFLVATGFVIFRLADRAFGRTAAVLGVVFYVLGLQTLLLGVSGGRATLAMFLVTLAALLLCAPDCTARRAGAAGAVLSLAYLTDTSNLVLVIPFGLFALYLGGPGRRRRLALFAVAFVMVAAAWWVRNAAAAGDPFYSLRHYWAMMFVPTHPGQTLYRSTDTGALNVWAFLIHNPREVVRKIVMGLLGLYTNVPRSYGLYIVAFFIAGALQPLQEPHTRLLRKCLYLALALQVLLAAAQNANADFASSLLPLVMVFAAGFFVYLLQRLGARAARGWAVAAFLALAAYPLLVALAAPGTAIPPNVSTQNLEYLQHALPAGTVVASDVPWAVAWYAKRPAVMLPLERRDFEAADKGAQIGAIYLSYWLQTWSGQEEPQPWMLMERDDRYLLPGFVRAWPRSQAPGEALFVTKKIAARLPIPPPGGGQPSEAPTAPLAPVSGPPGP